MSNLKARGGRALANMLPNRAASSSLVSVAKRKIALRDRRFYGVFAYVFWLTARVLSDTQMI
jgi:hypothetical protein